MTTRYDVHFDDGIVWVAAHGAIDPELGAEIERAAAECARRHQASRFYVDYRRATIKAATGHVRHFGSEMAQAGVPRSARHALVCNQRTADHALLENAYPGGSGEFRAFTDGGAALDWLRAQS